MIPPVSEMPVAATMRPTVRPTVAARGRFRLPAQPPPPTMPTGPRRTCGNCAFSADLLNAGGLSAVRVVCNRDGRGFDNNPVPNQRFPADRGGCLHHAYRSDPK